MTAQADPYSRFYWRFRDEFPDIYADKETFGWWMTLLANAEGAHPAAPELPRKIKTRSVQALIDSDLLTLLPNERYRLKGVTAEMERRAAKGRKGANARWSQSDGTASAMQTHSERTAKAMPRRDETSKDETSKSIGALALPVKTMNGGTVDVTLADLQEDAPPSDALRLMKLASELTDVPHVSPYTGYGLKAVNEQLPHGFDRVEKAWRKLAAQFAAAGTSKPTLKQLVLGADDILNPVPRQDAKEQSEEEARAAYDRRVAKTQELIRSLQS